MKIDLDTLKLVELDCFYDLSEKHAAAEVFKQAIQLKLRGYKHEYPYGVLPVDTTDFFGIHFMLCLQKDGNLEPIMAHKSINSFRCELHKVTFPAIHVLGANYVSLRAELERIVAEAHAENRPVYYGSSWTIDPMVRSTNRDLVGELRNIFVAINAFQYLEVAPAELVTCGVKRFKTEKFFNSTLGYSAIGGEDAATFKHAFISGEEMVMMHSKSITQTGINAAEPYRNLWENRLVLRGERYSTLLTRENKAA
jgi:hypothetical protein